MSAMKALAHGLFLLACGWAIAANAEVSNADVPARIELISFNSLTLSDSDVLTGREGQKVAHLAGELRLPQAVDKPPLVILLHGSSGMGAGTESWVRLLNSKGLATFSVDSFTGRGLTNVSKSQASLGRLNMVIDAYHAGDLLRADPRLDTKQVVLLGFSRGGQSALYASLLRLQRFWKGESLFKAFFAFYPDCSTQYLQDTELQAAPIRLFHGKSDDYNGFSRCVDYVDRLKASEVDVRLHTYPDSHHGFDYPLPLATRTLTGAQSTHACQIKESKAGILINEDTQVPFTYSDACVDHTPHVGANLETGKVARKDMIDDLCQVVTCRSKPST